MCVAHDYFRWLSDSLIRIPDTLRCRDSESTAVQRLVESPESVTTLTQYQLLELCRHVASVRLAKSLRRFSLVSSRVGWQVGLRGCAARLAEDYGSLLRPTASNP